MNAEITARTDQLHDQTVREQPAWLARFGARPEDAALARQWNRLVGLTAAYRETYGITTADAASPLGNQPASNDLRADAWRNITRQWRHLMTTSEPDLSTFGSWSTFETVDEALKAVFPKDEAAAEDESMNEAEEVDTDESAARRIELEEELVDGQGHGYGESAHRRLTY